MSNASATIRAFDRRWVFAFGFYFFVAFDIFTQSLSGNSLNYFLASLAIGYCAAAWCAEDAQLRCRPMLHVLQFLTFLFWPIAVPIYLIASRGVVGFGYLLLNAIAISLVAIIVPALTLSLP